MQERAALGWREMVRGSKKVAQARPAPHGYSAGPAHATPAPRLWPKKIHALSDVD